MTEEQNVGKGTLYSLDYLVGFQGSISSLRGCIIMYIDPSNKGGRTVRYGKIVSIGPKAIGVEPFNKFSKEGVTSALRPTASGMQFKILTDTDGSVVVVDTRMLQGSRKVVENLPNQ